MLCILNVVPGDVYITDVRCGAVNLINQCDMEWNVSVIFTCAIKVIMHMYISTLCTYKPSSYGICMH